ncbi:MAG: hypothetical protein M0Z94_05670 [Dehalococcoidales bacterium]|nr:hypothetical protein [Dehalococcoidales bacterium]
MGSWRRVLLVGGVIVALVLGLGAAGLAFAQTPTPNGAPWSGWTCPWWGNNGHGTPSPQGGPGYGPGMMGGRWGGGPGMMGGWGPQGNVAPTTGASISIDDAKKAVENYVAGYNDPNLAVDEVMEFQYNFYAIVKDNSTGIGAFEVLVNKSNSYVSPEIGPNMMWNTKYGHMGGWGGMMGGWGYGQPNGTNAGPLTVTPDQATQKAQEYLDRYYPGSTTEEPDQFPGYYTAHTLKDGKISGMLSVNGYTGDVWYHSWHGDFIQEIEG